MKLILESRHGYHFPKSWLERYYLDLAYLLRQIQVIKVFLTQSKSQYGGGVIFLIIQMFVRHMAEQPENDTNYYVERKFELSYYFPTLELISIHILNFCILVGKRDNGDAKIKECFFFLFFFCTGKSPIGKEHLEDCRRYSKNMSFEKDNERMLWNINEVLRVSFSTIYDVQYS